MNDITDELYNLLKAGDTQENLTKIKTLFQISDISKSAGLNRLTIELKSVKQENGFNLNILSYACRHLNLGALKFLMEERKDILDQINLNEGNPTPLFAATFQSNMNKSEEVVGYLMEKGASTNCRYEADVTGYERPLYNSTIRNPNLLHITMKKEAINLTKIFLLEGVSHLQKDGAYNKTPYEIAKNDNKVEEITRMMECLDYIKLAKEAYSSKNMPMMLAHMANAYQKDNQFLIDYLAHEFKDINLGKAKPDQDYSYLIKFMDIIGFISNSDFNQEIKVYQNLQEKVLPELGGYDAQSGVIKLWDTNQKKQEYFRKFSKGASWENTASLLTGFSPVFSQTTAVKEENKNTSSSQKSTGFSFNTNN